MKWRVIGIAYKVNTPEREKKQEKEEARAIHFLANLNFIRLLSCLQCQRDSHRRLVITLQYLLSKLIGTILFQYLTCLLPLFLQRVNIMDADVILQVIEYLSKKGYSKTESMLRQESANQDVEGRPINTKSEETGGAKYGKAFGECQVLSYAFEHPTELHPRIAAILD